MLKKLLFMMLSVFLLISCGKAGQNQRVKLASKGKIENKEVNVEYMENLEGLLWKVEYEGVVSYLYASNQIGNKSFTLNKDLKRTIESTDAFLVEIFNDNNKDEKTLQEVKKQVKKKKTFKAFVSENLYQKIINLYRKEYKNYIHSLTLGTLLGLTYDLKAQESGFFTEYTSFNTISSRVSSWNKKVLEIYSSFDALNQAYDKYLNIKDMVQLLEEVIDLPSENLGRHLQVYQKAWIEGDMVTLKYLAKSFGYNESKEKNTMHLAKNAVKALEKQCLNAKVSCFLLLGDSPFLTKKGSIPELLQKKGYKITRIKSIKSKNNFQKIENKEVKRKARVKDVKAKIRGEGRKEKIKGGLWKVEHKEGTSYVYGTIRYYNQKVVFSQRLEEALKEVEYVIIPYDSRKEATPLPKMLTTSKVLKDKIPDSLYQKLLQLTDGTEKSKEYINSRSILGAALWVDSIKAYWSGHKYLYHLFLLQKFYLLNKKILAVYSSSKDYIDVFNGIYREEDYIEVLRTCFELPISEFKENLDLKVKAWKAGNLLELRDIYEKRAKEDENKNKKEETLFRLIIKDSIEFLESKCLKTEKNCFLILNIQGALMEKGNALELLKKKGYKVTRIK